LFHGRKGKKKKWNKRINREKTVLPPNLTSCERGDKGCRLLKAEEAKGTPFIDRKSPNKRCYLVGDNNI